MIRTILSILLCIPVFCGSGQMNDAKTFEIGIGAGEAYYVGELSPNHFQNLKLSGQAFFKFNQNNRVSYRLNVLYARLGAADADADNLTRINRNLDFKSDVIELGGMVEINFFDYLPGDLKRYQPYTPYLFGGISYFHHNPTGSYNDDYIELQPLGTEGQGSSANEDKKYNLNQISIPFGIGLKATITSHLAIAIEYGLRKTFTDYLDDVSGYYADPVVLKDENGSLALSMADKSLNQEGLGASNAGARRGNPYNKDWYGYGGISICFLFGKTSMCDNFGQKRFH